MKQDLEDLLREAPLRGPSQALAGRIEDAYAHAGARRRRWLSSPIPLWACSAAAIICGVAGYVARGAGRPPRVVYVLPVEGDLARALSGAAQQRPDDWFEKVEVRVTRPASKKL
jgi:hypothetical protein